MYPPVIKRGNGKSTIYNHVHLISHDFPYENLHFVGGCSIAMFDDFPEGTRPGKHTKNYGKIHHFSWENPLFLWSFSIAILT